MVVVSGTFNALEQMKTSAQKQEVAAQNPAIVSAVDLAPVVPGGIENKNNKATAEQMARFVAQIRQGKPTGNIFGTKLSEMDFTTAQRQEIADARKFHRYEAQKSAKNIAKLFVHKDTVVTGHRTNHDGNKGRASYVLKSAFVGKDGKHAPDKLARYMDGPKIKATA